ncbi:AAA family ATPase [Rhodoferax sp. 4810]|nr:bifunctional aminoglycoside phosphotransferase/ATP-binding protein [Thiospirillum jenense]MBB1073381.1 AAA family ATPase [Rhodoferax jenense]
MTTALDQLHHLLNALQQPSAYPHPVVAVKMIETHISVVLLAGAYAYKLKKPLSLGFLDFSTIEHRRHCCEEEVRINRRLAAGLYCGVVTIRGDLINAHIEGDGEILDYAVKMRRFSQQALLTHTTLTRNLIDQIAVILAQFHSKLPSAPLDSHWGTPSAVLSPMLQNVEQIRTACIDPYIRTRVDRIARWTHLSYKQLLPILEQRRRDGAIRECHGDVHRGNIALIDGQPMIFDALEFNPALRWIDCMSELAFLTMDIRDTGALRLMRRLINRYLELTGDYSGLAVLRFYQVYRALVRAKVHAIRFNQPNVTQAERTRDYNGLRRYLHLARACIKKNRPRLLITHGLSGSGKTWLGHVLCERLPLIHIRSDVERKRLCGLTLDVRPTPEQMRRLYDTDMTARTYQHLTQQARAILTANYSVLVDATFLKQMHRALFFELAQEIGCPIMIISLAAPPPILRARVLARLAEGIDASDANAEILANQRRHYEPLNEEEHRYAHYLTTEKPLHIIAFLRHIKRELSEQSQSLNTRHATSRS